MRHRTAILVALGAAAAAASAAMAAGPDVNRGRWVATGGFYEEAGGIACARCHDLNGSGDSSGAFPRLSDQSAWYLYKTLKDFAAGLRPNEVMQQVAREMTDAEMADVSAYYAAIDDAPYPPPPDVDQQVLQIGGAIAAIGVPGRGVPACNTCHGEDGAGAPPIYPFLAGQFAPYLEHQLMLWKRGVRDGDPLNIMEFVAKNMTDDQIRAVSLYFASLRPAEVTPQEDLYLTLEQVGERGPPGTRPAQETEPAPASGGSAGTAPRGQPAQSPTGTTRPGQRQPGGVQGSGRGTSGAQQGEGGVNESQPGGAGLE
ncbi:c-type cytochrome [Rhodoligotrophos defluvii]|uniref:c-type cytochrome n=1 Tax=Rhodoligotrophos defluvii TaxID=2561934 RepID=UPI0010C9A813|nr:c-type cytochrome [Rhodoligotrophos defluvii]